MAGLQYHKVVVPVDFSQPSIKAVDTALKITGDPSAVHILHVIENLTPAHPGELYGTIDDETRAKHAVEALEKQFGDAKYAGINIETATGAPGVVIPDHAAAIQADLIVMPSHGRSGIARMLIGSVTERAIRYAHCPMLVLRD